MILKNIWKSIVGIILNNIFSFEYLSKMAFTCKI